MSKFVETTFGGTQEILKFPDHYVAMPVMVSDSGVSANEQGKKIVPKGTIIGGASAAVLRNLDQAAVNKFVDAAYADKTIGATGSNNAIYGKALEPGTGGNSIKITLVDPSANDEPLAVAVTGKEIVVTLATGGAGAITSTAAQVVTALNANEVVAEFAIFTADIESNDGGSGACGAVAETAFDGGHNGVVTGAEGVLKNDIDVTYGPKEGAMILHGFIKVAALPYGSKNDLAADAAASALPIIKFIK